MLKLEIKANKKQYDAMMKLLGRMSDMKLSKFFTFLKKGIQEGSQRAFATASTPGGIRWKKRKKEQPWPILQKTKTMKDNVQKQSAWMIQGDRLVFRDSTQYGIYHQYGTSKMPAREWIAFPSDNLISQAFFKFLESIGF